MRLASVISLASQCLYLFFLFLHFFHFSILNCKWNPAGVSEANRLRFLEAEWSGGEEFFFRFCAALIRFRVGVGEEVVVLISSKHASRTVLLFTPTVLRPPRERLLFL